MKVRIDGLNPDLLEAVQALALPQYGPQASLKLTLMYANGTPAALGQSHQRGSHEFIRVNDINKGQNARDSAFKDELAMSPCSSITMATDGTPKAQRQFPKDNLDAYDEKWRNEAMRRWQGCDYIKPLEVEGPNEEHGEYSAVISLAVCTNVTTQKHKQEFYWQVQLEATSREGAQISAVANSTHLGKGSFKYVANFDRFATITLDEVVADERSGPWRVYCWGENVAGSGTNVRGRCMLEHDGGQLQLNCEGPAKSCFITSIPELSVLSGPLYIYFETLEGDTVVATSEKKAVLTAEGVHVSAQGGRSSIGSGRIAAMNCLGDLLVDLGDLEVIPDDLKALLQQDGHQQRTFKVTDLQKVGQWYFPTRLSTLCLTGQTELIKAFLEEKGTAEVDCIDSCSSQCPLHLALLNGHDDAAMLLLRSGASVMVDSLLRAAASHCTLTTEFIIQTCDDSNVFLYFDSQQNEPRARPSLATTLTRVSSSDSEGEAQEGETPLHVLAKRPESDLPLMLKEKSVPFVKELVSARDSTGATPLHLAMAFGSAETVKCLIEMGSDVTACDNEGKEPTEYAVLWKRLELLSLLDVPSRRAHEYEIEELPE